MSNFVVLDPTLRGVGHHNFEYDLRLLRAAERQGWQPVLGSHRDLGHEPELVEGWKTYRAFRSTRHTPIVHKLHRCRRRLATAQGVDGAFAFGRRLGYQIDQWRYQQRYERMTRGYRRALDEIWAGCRPKPGDQVFLPSAMPSDMAGLADWARRNPSAREVDWHLEFHFPLVGAETWYAHSSRQYGELLTDVPEMLEDLIGALGRRRVHLYATTPLLAAQFEHCLGEPFQTLHYPSNPSIGALRAATILPASAAGQNRLRTICAGQPRSEKGAQHWSQIVDTLTADYFATGRLQLALQAGSHQDLPEPLRRLAAELDAPVAGRGALAPVELVGWPLSAEDYLAFLASAHIGLLMYDPLAYQFRISGVLVELLGAGVPVVVPAGCALADQISEPIFAHQQQLRERLPVVANLSMAQLDWKVAVPHRSQRGIAVGVDTPCAETPAAVCQTAVPAHASHLLILLARDAPNGWNRYLSVSVEQRDGEGKTHARRRDIVGYRDSGGRMTVLVPLEPRSRQVEIRLQTALGHELLVLRQMECCFLAAPDRSQVAHGAVGQWASDPGQAAECLRDIIDHHDHYEQTASAMAAQWAHTRTAEGLLRELTNRAAGAPIERRRAA